MAVDADTYGTEAGVELLIGDVVDGRAFTGSTVPTSTQVEGILDQIAGVINNALEAQGYSAPVVLADNPYAHRMLVRANDHGAAADIIAAFFPHMAFNAEGEPTDRLTYYRQALKDALDTIQRGALSAGLTRRIFAGSQEDSDGNTKLPLFKRDKFDYPGARTLTE